MSTDIERARVLWRCRRGMLELDLLLGRFMNEGYAQLTDDQSLVFKKLLEEPDPDLYSWLMGYATPDDPELSHFVEWFREHFSNAKKKL
jgi:antitoxin CptB